mmetsp:Transcript_38265/g.73367  ORF Transcript_38265/g.73367 Transcript_38265/m.73367 type:complete len:206 (-) Transcript_38265:421-1038(-)
MPLAQVVITMIKTKHATLRNLHTAHLHMLFLSFLLREEKRSMPALEIVVQVQQESQLGPPIPIEIKYEVTFRTDATPRPGCINVRTKYLVLVVSIASPSHVHPAQVASLHVLRQQVAASLKDGANDGVVDGPLDVGVGAHVAADGERRVRIAHGFGHGCHAHALLPGEHTRHHKGSLHPGHLVPLQNSLMIISQLQGVWCICVYG